MADITFALSEPVAAIVSAASQVTVAVLKVIEVNRTTASQASRDEQDHISTQVYWDWRDLCEKVGLVGARLPWPPAAK